MQRLGLSGMNELSPRHSEGISGTSLSCWATVSHRGVVAWSLASARAPVESEATVDMATTPLMITRREPQVFDFVTAPERL